MISNIIKNNTLNVPKKMRFLIKKKTIHFMILIMKMRKKIDENNKKEFKK